jgi:hypothetical protein
MLHQLQFDFDDVFLTGRDVKLTYKTLKEKIKEINKKDAKFYSNMFSKMTKPSGEESVSISASFTVISCSFLILL